MMRSLMRNASIWLLATVVTAVFTTLAWTQNQEAPIYTFPGEENGWPSGNLVFDESSNLYGTTYTGEVFQLVPSDGVWTYNGLYNFSSGGEDNTWGPTLDNAGNLYGTTYNDGSSGYGIVFELVPSSNGTWNRKVIRAFDGAHGPGHPYGPVIFDKARNLYGTAEVGSKGAAIVFKLTFRPQGQWKIDVIHSFGASGVNPRPVFDSAGNLYVTTNSGGAHGAGSVVKLTLVKGKWTEQALYDFAGEGDGSYPNAGVLFDAEGNLYGTTSYGSTYGGGVVYELTPSQHGSWNESVIENFRYNPYSLILDSAGNLYGTSGELVFELQHLKDGQWREDVLYQFAGNDAHAGPQGLVFDGSGNLFGATEMGGSYQSGTIYELMP